MGSTQSYLSPEVIVTAAVVAGAVGFGYKQVASSSDSSAPSAISGSLDRGTGGKKGKKKANAAGTAQTPDSQISVVPFPAVVPGQFDDEASEISPGIGLEASASSSKSKKGKKKAGKTVSVQREKDTAGIDSLVEEAVVSPAAAVTLADSNPSPTNSKKKKRQSSSQNNTAKSSPPSSSPAAAANAPPPPKTNSSTRKLEKSTTSLASLATESDGEWTRVSRRVDKPGTSSAAGAVSDVGHTTTTGTSSPIDTRTEEGEEEEEEHMSGPGERHPLANRLLPKPRKTGVEDMLATSDYPSYSRVMRVQPGDKPATGFSWGDYEDVIGGDNAGGELDGDGGADADGEDDGWGVVKRGGRPKNSSSFSQSTLSASRAASAPETMTKRQRQNAANRAMQKAAKADAERERVATLAKHKRELEQAKIEAQFGKGGSKKFPSGGMQAGVDAKGKLVWE